MISFENVHFVRDNIPILNGIHFTIQKSDSVVILGRNGAGKSTLLNLIYGNLWPTQGSISVLGFRYGETVLKPIQQKLGVVLPNHQESMLQSLTTLEMVLTGLFGTVGLYSEPNSLEVQRAKDLLDSVGLLSKEKQLYSSLSLGERMKILLLRSLAEEKEILLLDEPTAALDITARFAFMQSLQKWKLQKPHTTRLLITHRVEEIPEDFSQVLLLKAGKILSFGEKGDTLTNELLSELYDLPIQVHSENGMYSCSVRKNP